MELVTFILYLTLAFVSLVFLIGFLLSEKGYKGPVTDHYDGKRFMNPSGEAANGFNKLIQFLRNRKPDPWIDRSDIEVPNQEIDHKVSNSESRLYFINHSSFLIQLNEANILTDPIYSDRCSPFSFAGPKRLRPPGVHFEDLPDIKIVLISHNHYDHLDFNSVVKLNECSIKAGKPIEFIVPLGLKKWFQKYVPTAEKVTELDWHGQFCLDDVTVTALPMQHWSSRYGYDKDKTLWCGFQVKTKSKNLLFCGDTGYFEEAREIGKRYGPFDFALIPIGAYEPRWFMINQHCK